MKPMAVVQIKASELTGEKGEEEEFGRPMSCSNSPSWSVNSRPRRRAGRYFTD
jgi:hypothetical protein